MKTRTVAKHGLFSVLFGTAASLVHWLVPLDYWVMEGNFAFQGPQPAPLGGERDLFDLLGTGICGIAVYWLLAMCFARTQWASAEGSPWSCAKWDRAVVGGLAGCYGGIVFCPQMHWFGLSAVALFTLLGTMICAQTAYANLLVAVLAAWLVCTVWPFLVGGLVEAGSQLGIPEVLPDQVVLCLFLLAMGGGAVGASLLVTRLSRSDTLAVPES